MVIWATLSSEWGSLRLIFFVLKSCFVKLSQLNSRAERNNIHFKAVQYNISAAHWCLANERCCSHKHLDWTIAGNRVSTFWDVFIWSTWGGPPSYPVYDLPLSKIRLLNYHLKNNYVAFSGTNTIMSWASMEPAVHSQRLQQKQKRQLYQSISLHPYNFTNKIMPEKSLRVITLKYFLATSL